MTPSGRVYDKRTEVGDCAMGFMRSLGRIIQGKPVYDPSEEFQSISYRTDRHPEGADQAMGQDVQQQQQQPQPIPGGHEQQGYKLVPIVQMRRVECHNNGPRMDVYADIHNDSTQNINVDRITIAGASRALGKRLRPGEAQQFLVYSGTRPHSNPGGYADLQYRTEEGGGDYFIAQHRLQTKQEPDGTFSLYGFQLMRPIKDIH